jgi:hypothetical protein
MNMEFSQTSGSKPELDRGTGIILKYDAETANGQAVCLVREFLGDGGRQKRFPVTLVRVARNQLILHDLRHDRYGETGFRCRRSGAKKQLPPARMRVAAGTSHARQSFNGRT